MLFSFVHRNKIFAKLGWEDAQAAFPTPINKSEDGDIQQVVISIAKNSKRETEVKNFVDNSKNYKTFTGTYFPPLHYVCDIVFFNLYRILSEVEISHPSRIPNLLLLCPAIKSDEAFC